MEPESNLKDSQDESNSGEGLLGGTLWYYLPKALHEIKLCCSHLEQLVEDKKTSSSIPAIAREGIEIQAKRFILQLSGTTALLKTCTTGVRNVFVEHFPNLADSIPKFDDVGRSDVSNVKIDNQMTDTLHLPVADSTCRLTPNKVNVSEEKKDSVSVPSDDESSIASDELHLIQSRSRIPEAIIVETQFSNLNSLRNRCLSNSSTASNFSSSNPECSSFIEGKESCECSLKPKNLKDRSNESTVVKETKVEACFLSALENQLDKTSSQGGTGIRKPVDEHAPETDNHNIGNANAELGSNEWPLDRIMGAEVDTSASASDNINIKIEPATNSQIFEDGEGENERLTQECFLTIPSRNEKSFQINDTSGNREVPIMEGEIPTPKSQSELEPNTGLNYLPISEDTHKVNYMGWNLGRECCVVMHHMSLETERFYRDQWMKTNPFYDDDGATKGSDSDSYLEDIESGDNFESLPNSDEYRHEADFTSNLFEELDGQMGEWKNLISQGEILLNSNLDAADDETEVDETEVDETESYTETDSDSDSDTDITEGEIGVLAETAKIMNEELKAAKRLKKEMNRRMAIVDFIASQRDSSSTESQDEEVKRNNGSNYFYDTETDEVETPAPNVPVDSGLLPSQGLGDNDLVDYHSSYSDLTMESSYSEDDLKNKSEIRKKKRRKMRPKRRQTKPLKLDSTDDELCSETKSKDSNPSTNLPTSPPTVTVPSGSEGDIDSIRPEKLPMLKPKTNYAVLTIESEVDSDVQELMNDDCREIPNNDVKVLKIVKKEKEFTTPRKRFRSSSVSTTFSTSSSDNACECELASKRPRMSERDPEIISKNTPESKSRGDPAEGTVLSTSSKQNCSTEIVQVGDSDNTEEFHLLTTQHSASLNSTDVGESSPILNNSAPNDQLISSNSLNSGIITVRNTNVPKGRRYIREIKETVTKEAVAESERRAKQDEHTQWLDEINREGKKLMLSEKPLIEVHKSISVHLKQHQREGVQFLWANCFLRADLAKQPGNGCILSHCMGLGKSLQSLAFLHTILTNKELGVKKCLILCPLTVASNWTTENKKWLRGDMKRVKFYNFSNLLDAFNDNKSTELLKELNIFKKKGGIGVIHYDGLLTLIGARQEQSLKSAETKAKNLKQNPSTSTTALTSIGSQPKNLRDPELTALAKEILMNPNILICDEGHALKNNKTNIYKTIKSINTKRKIILTGTPMQNNLMEYYWMMQLVKPNVFGSHHDFANAYVNPIENGNYEDSKEEDKLLAKKREYRLCEETKGFVQRKFSDVLGNFIPPKYEFAIFVNLTELQQRLYRSFIERIDKMVAKKLISNEIDKRNAREGLLYHYSILQQLGCHPKLLYEKNREKKSVTPNTVEAENEQEVNFEDESIQAWINSAIPVNDRKRISDDWTCAAKLTVLQEIIDSSIKEGDKLLVFSKWVTTLNVIEEFLRLIPVRGNRLVKGKDFFRMDGRVSVNRRNEYCRKFNNTSKSIKLFLISTQVGGLGLNLCEANRIVLFDVSMNPSSDNQSIFRAYRLGQKKPCYVYRLIARGGMEETTYNRCLVKLSVSGRVVDEQQVARNVSVGNVNNMYIFNPNSQPVGAVDQAKEVEDPVLKNLILTKRSLVACYVEHNTLFEDQEQEHLNEQEKENARNEIIENLPEKKRGRKKGVTGSEKKKTVSKVTSKLSQAETEQSGRSATHSLLSSLGDGCHPLNSAFSDLNLGESNTTIEIPGSMDGLNSIFPPTFPNLTPYTQSAMTPLPQGNETCFFSECDTPRLPRHNRPTTFVVIPQCPPIVIPPCPPDTMQFQAHPINYSGRASSKNNISLP